LDRGRYAHIRDGRADPTLPQPAAGIGVALLVGAVGSLLALRELGVKGDRQHLERVFETRTAERWEEWAAERDLPLAAVRSAEYGGRDKEDEIVSAS